MKNKIFAAALALMLMLFAFCSCGKKEKTHGEASSTKNSSIALKEEQNISSQPKNTMLKAIEEKIATKVVFYYVDGKKCTMCSGYVPLYVAQRDNIKPFSQISGKDEAEQFKKSLKLEKWFPENYSLRGLPKIVVYLGSDLQMTLWGQLEDKSYISLANTQGKEFFRVPNDVYDKITKLYEDTQK